VPPVEPGRLRALTTWRDFEAARPDLARAGAALLHQHGVGLAYLATTAADGSPRVHPICPLLIDGHLCAFIIPSPKQRDLQRDGRYALHSFPTDDNEDAFYVAGTAAIVTDPDRRAAAAAQFVREREQHGVAAPATDDLLVEFGIARCLLTTSSGHGDPQPDKTSWQG
jgi:hypothetical protein